MLEDTVKSKVLFAGTSEFAIPTLNRLICQPDIEIIAVLTQPDRQAGRGRKLKLSPIKEVAISNNIRVLEPTDLNRCEGLREILTEEIKFLVVVSYGLMIPSSVVEKVNFAINIHASILPNWRGAAPMQYAIMNGDQFAGVSIMEVVEKLDAGPIFCSESIRLEEDETYGSLSNKLALLGSDKLMETISALKKGIFEKKSQNDKFATYAAKITKEDRKINWNIDALTIERKIRALNPTPSATTQFNNQIIKLYEVRIEKNIPPLPPGDWLIDKKKKQIIVGTTTDSISITKIQKPGGKIMNIKEFLNGFTNKNDV